MGIGLIRLLLAESVVMAHSYDFFGYQLLDPVKAVEMFFIISGFYMAMILDGKYSSYWLFIKNRFLRLYPIYITIAILTIAISTLSFFILGDWFKLSTFIEQFHSFRVGGYAFLVLTNLTMFFQDVTVFAGLPEIGKLFFVNGVNTATIPIQRLLLIPPAWTLGLEWLFYLIVPFIAKKTRIVILLIISSLLLRVFLASAGLTGDPWGYRFFPAELYLFCGGILAYDFFKKYKKTLNLKIAKIITIVFIVYVLVFNFLPIPAIALYVIFISALPFIFLYSKSFKIDRKIGELSYPVYLAHILIFSCLEKIGIFSHLANGIKLALLSSAVIIFSVFLIKYIQEPIDRIREFNLIKNGFYTNYYFFLQNQMSDIEI
jgi:peptidoglycan/LPS O-acetylase OafA/YrhL